MAGIVPSCPWQLTFSETAEAHLQNVLSFSGWVCCSTWPCHELREFCFASVPWEVQNLFLSLRNSILSAGKAIPWHPRPISSGWGSPWEFSCHVKDAERGSCWRSHTTRSYSLADNPQDIKTGSIVGKKMVRSECGGWYSEISLSYQQKLTQGETAHTSKCKQTQNEAGERSSVPSKPDFWGSPETLLCSCRDLGKLPCRFCTGATVHPCKFYKVLSEEPRDEQGKVSSCCCCTAVEWLALCWS